MPREGHNRHPRRWLALLLWRYLLLVHHRRRHRNSSLASHSSALHLKCNVERPRSSFQLKPA